jgi:hypothetical protein
MTLGRNVPGPTGCGQKLSVSLGQSLKPATTVRSRSFLYDLLGVSAGCTSAAAIAGGAGMETLDRHLEVRVTRLQVVLRRDQRAEAEPLGNHVGGQPARAVPQTSIPTASSMAMTLASCSLIGGRVEADIACIWVRRLR